jgi:hypothetical protein
MLSLKSVLVHQWSSTCAPLLVLHMSVEHSVCHQAYGNISGQIFQTAFCVLSIFQHYWHWWNINLIFDIAAKEEMVGRCPDSILYSFNLPALLVLVEHKLDL